METLLSGSSISEKEDTIRKIDLILRNFYESKIKS